MLKKEWPKHTILAIAIIATWLKTYIAYQTGFSITIDNSLQEFILFLSPLSLLLFLYGLSLFFKSEKNRNRYLVEITGLDTGSQKLIERLAIFNSANAKLPTH